MLDADAQRDPLRASDRRLATVPTRCRGNPPAGELPSWHAWQYWLRKACALSNE